MKEIKAFHCDFCNKITLSKSGMYKHESICFYNPKTKSCVTCIHLDVKNCMNGIPITEREEDILQLKIDGTYHISRDLEATMYKVLNDEYEYLYKCEPENFCKAKSIILNKLTAKCDLHKVE